MPKTADTPLMKQWRDVKSRHSDAMVFFRVGDFYEFFYEDAEEGARLLGLTLTSRNNGSAAKVPLAGVPARALDDYLARLIKHGRRVAICEQVEDPSEAQGIVRREVVETVTPGTVLHDQLLDARQNNYLAAVVDDGEGRHALAAMDLSTGELNVSEVGDAELAGELGRLGPSELLLPAGAAMAGEPWFEEARATRTYRADWIFDYETARSTLERSFRVQSLEGLGFGSSDELMVRAIGALVTYVSEIQPAGTGHLRVPRIHRPGASMLLDEMTRRNLELVQPLRAGEESGTLLDTIDCTQTAMGARLLRRWLLAPLVDAARIWSRQDGVTGFFEDPDTRGTARDALSRVHDLERMAGKLGAGRGTPRELLALATSLRAIEPLLDALEGAPNSAVRSLGTDVDRLADVRDAITAAIASDAPASLGDGGVIAPGYDAELDELRGLRDGAVDFIAAVQTRERERTGISSLKIGFNKVFGYYLEVTRANLDRVPDDYIRKQTLANAERYFTPELKEWEEKVADAEDGILEREGRLFSQLRSELQGDVPRIQLLAERLARIDVLSAFAEHAQRADYVRPEVHTGFELDIVEGRHPVVETMTGRSQFIPNSLRLDEDRRIVMLTGPNMAGKSTVLRQIGLIQLLAQIGSFVPADRAKIPMADRIFTRVGASDNLVRGQSTFMVEMTETASILHGATASSLVLLDEIGRGTSTYDGVSIAWSVTEHLHERVGAKSVFATHYHELTQLGDLLPAVVNLNVSVREVGEEVVFLRRLEEGGADRSYGIQVARLAGLPTDVLARAKEILTELEGAHTSGGHGLGRSGAHRPRSEPDPDQLGLPLGGHPLLDELKALDVDGLTPLEALNRLAKWRDQYGGKA